MGIVPYDFPAPGWSQPTTTKCFSSPASSCLTAASCVPPGPPARNSNTGFRLSYPRMLIHCFLPFSFTCTSSAMLFSGTFPEASRMAGVSALSCETTTSPTTTTTAAAARPNAFLRSTTLSGFTRLLAWCVATHAASTNARTSATIAIRVTITNNTVSIMITASTNRFAQSGLA